MLERLNERLIQIFFGALGAVLVLVVQAWWLPQPQLVTLDPARLLEQELSGLAIQQLDDLALEQQANTFGRGLDQALHTLYQRDRLLVIHRQAVLTADVPDVTDWVMEQLRLRQERQ